MSDQRGADDHSVGGQHSKISQANQIYHIESEKQIVLQKPVKKKKKKCVTDDIVMNITKLIYIYFMFIPVFSIYAYL